MYSHLSFGWLFKALILALLLGLPLARPAEANHLRNDAAKIFYLKLAPYGTWVRHGIYGRVWFPRNVPEYWRPYQDGYWAYTNDYGWLWVSDWVWGWATDHYGRWVWDDWYGWIWVPGAVWAPAWVVWRYGDGYVSWAPMPIQYVWNPYAASYANYYFDFDRYIFWDCWVTTHEHDFPRRNTPRKWLAPKMSREILHRTRYAEPLTLSNNNIVNPGVPLQQIERATGSAFKPVEPRVVLEAGEDNARRRRPKNREEVMIYRPIDNQPTIGTIRDEVESDKVLAEKINVNRQLSSDRNSSAGENLEYRRPGRLTGRPKPLDDQEEENPLTIQPETRQTSPTFVTLPGMQENLQAEPGRNEAIPQRDQLKSGSARLRRQDQEGVRELPVTIEDVPQRTPQELKRELFDWQGQGNRRQESGVQGNQQQLQLERQQQVEQERLQREAIGRQEETAREQQHAEEERMRQETILHQDEAARQQQIEAERRQLQIEQQQQVEQERMQRETIRHQDEAARQQQLETERQQQAEPETIRQQQEVVRERQQQMEQQQQAEQERMRQEETVQQEEAARQQQLQMERQQQAEQERLQQGAMRQQQEEMARQQQLEMERQQQAIQQQQQTEISQPGTMQQAQPDGSGRGRVGRGMGRGR
ncbi:DUF6600 domain-containing protein [Methylomicrobium sp. Wu6]|uniref:DUF6600 domain-containing protein n=1 Tax=Methylomicrobium sp. Wu6 TaxID=3107928 RepID=UPI002DD64138|nr:DUF6600 domain-containing protein [Methylomicrobium sp. Wu6]MEC4749390.1 DUF6600 domain-containing protein [Methylomicrobium sp. Wu6]